MSRPNLFHFASSELSQDAFICWLLEWSDARHDDENPALHEAAKEFVNAMLAKHQRSDLPQHMSVEIRWQYRGIDVVAVLDDQFALPN